MQPSIGASTLWLKLQRQAAMVAVAVASIGIGLTLVGDVWPPADIVSPFLIHMLAFGGVASLALLIERQQAKLLALGALLIVCGHATLSYASCCGESPPSRRIVLGPWQGAPLRVVTLNTWHDHPAPETLVGQLASSGADIVVLTEFGPNKAHLLEAFRPQFPHQVSCAAMWACSIVILSKLPIEDSGTTPHRLGLPQLAYARLRIEARGETALTPRVTRLITIVGAHVWRPSRDPYRHALEMEGLGTFLRSIGGPAILAADLNATPWSASYHRLGLRTGLVASSRLLPNWPAWPVAAPQFALDHILVSADLAVEAAGVGHPTGSDHLPIWATIRLQTPPLGAWGSRLATPLLLGGDLFADLGREHGAARHVRR